MSHTCLTCVMYYLELEEEEIDTAVYIPFQMMTLMKQCPMIRLPRRHSCGSKLNFVGRKYRTKIWKKKYKSI